MRLIGLLAKWEPLLACWLAPSVGHWSEQLHCSVLQVLCLWVIYWPGRATKIICAIHYGHCQCVLKVSSSPCFKAVKSCYPLCMLCSYVVTVFIFLDVYCCFFPMPKQNHILCKSNKDKNLFIKDLFVTQVVLFIHSFIEFDSKISTIWKTWLLVLKKYWWHQNKAHYGILFKLLAILNWIYWISGSKIFLKWLYQEVMENICSCSIERLKVSLPCRLTTMWNTVSKFTLNKPQV